MYVTMSVVEYQCCICPKRANCKDKYFTIGERTVEKFQPHSRCKIIIGTTRACQTCYKQITRKPKQAVMAKSGTVGAITVANGTLRTMCKHIFSHSACCQHMQQICSNSCVQKHPNNQLDTLAAAAMESRAQKHKEEDDSMKHKYDDKVMAKQ